MHRPFFRQRGRVRSGDFMEREPEISIRLFSDPQLLAPIRALMDAFAKGVGFSEKTRGLLTLALDEALANVIRHGYEERKEGLIWINFWRLREPGGIRVVLEDLGRSVDPALIQSRNLDDVRPGGLGVHIIKETMSESSWESRPGGGMRLTLVKWLSEEERQQSAQSQSENTRP
ncbi:MAG: ATP-binding protein [Phycisphaerales bacterium]|nr:ATP-binding protein [Phycisphaerales bacterium]